MISDDTLILYYYVDGLTEAERETVRRQLEHSAPLRAHYEALCEGLRSLIDECPAEVPASTVAHWRRALDEEIESERKPYPLAWLRHRGFALAAALSIVFVGGLYVGTQLAGESGSSINNGSVIAGGTTLPSLAEPRSTPQPPREQAVFARGVAAHLKSTQIRLASLDLDNAREREALIEQIVLQNRFFLNAADDNSAHDVARLLRAFEPLLLSMLEEDTGQKTIAQVRDQLEFEMSASLTKFNQRASNQTNEF